MVESPLKSVLVVNRPLFGSLEPLRALARVTFLDQVDRQLFKQQVREAIRKTGGFDALLFMRRQELPVLDPLDEELLDDLVAAGLRFITSGGAGFDGVDIDYLTSKGVSYANNPAAVGLRTADSTSSMILQVLRGTTQMEAYVRATAEGQWRRPNHIIRDARKSTLGIIGLGNIGHFVSKQMHMFGMRVVYTQRRRLQPSEEQGATFMSMDELLATSDVVSILCPLTDATHHLISYQEFSKMKDGVLIVNTARGPIVDEQALVDSLASGKVLRAALDVFENEPRIHPALLANSAVTVLPHVAAMNETIRLEIETEQISNVRAFLKTGRGNTPVN